MEASFERDRLYNVQIDIYISQNRRFTYLVWSLLTTLFIWNQKFRNSFVSTVTSYIPGYHWMLEHKLEKLYSALLSQQNFNTKYLKMRVFTWLVFQDQLGVTDHPDTVWISGWCVVLPRCSVHIVVSVRQLVSLPSNVFLYVQTPSVYAMMYAGPCSVYAGLYSVYAGPYSVNAGLYSVYVGPWSLYAGPYSVYAGLHSECV